MYKTIVITLDEDTNKYVPIEAGGYNKFILPSIVDNIICDLMDYCEDNTDDSINLINSKLVEDINVKLKNTKYKPKDKTGYVYVLRCADKFKIGYTKNIERRISQLDTRPFKLELCFKTYHMNAYDVEQKIHKQLKDFQIANEWYEGITEKQIIDTINMIMRDYK